MQIFYKALFVFSCVIFHNYALSQNQYTPFKGAVQLGTGLSTIIDFNPENIGILIPYQIGIGTFKYVSSSEYLAFGFTVTKRGTHYLEKIEYQGGTSRTWYRLTLHYLDVPVSFHSSISWFKKHNSFFFVGLNNSVLLKYPVHRNVLHVDDEFFRVYNISIFAGISIQKHKNFRWSFKLNQSILSILKPEFKEEIQKINEDYGVRVYPIEFIVSCAYVFD